MPWYRLLWRRRCSPCAAVRLGVRRWQTLAIQFGMTLAAAALLISCDLYYRSLLHPPAVANTDPQPPTAEGPARGETPATQTPRLSWRQGLADLTWVNPFGLSSVETVTALFWQRADHLRGWDRQGPTQVLTIGIWLLSLLALIGLLPRNSRGAAARDPLVRFLLAGVAIWFGLKYLMTFAPAVCRGRITI